MPLFKCTKCDCVENTAVGQFWGQPKDEVICSQCATGKWHGLFPKKTMAETGYETDPLDNRFVAPKGGWK